MNRAFPHWSPTRTLGHEAFGREWIDFRDSAPFPSLFVHLVLPPVHFWYWPFSNSTQQPIARLCTVRMTKRLYIYMNNYTGCQQPKEQCCMRLSKSTLDGYLFLSHLKSVSLDPHSLWLLKGAATRWNRCCKQVWRCVTERGPCFLHVLPTKC